MSGNGHWSTLTSYRFRFLDSKMAVSIQFLGSGLLTQLLAESQQNHGFMISEFLRMKVTRIWGISSQLPKILMAGLCAFLKKIFQTM